MEKMSEETKETVAAILVAIFLKFSDDEIDKIVDNARALYRKEIDDRIDEHGKYQNLLFNEND